MPKYQLQKLLNLITISSNKIRQKLPQYGYNKTETDKFIQELVKEELRSCQTVRKTYQNVRQVQEGRIGRGLGNGVQGDCQEQYWEGLVKIVGKLEDFLKEIEQFEDEDRISSSANLDESIKEKSIQQGQQEFTCKSIESTSSFYKYLASSKLSNETSAQTDSFVTQQIRLKSSLKNMIKKTRMLREMLEHSIFMTSLRELEGFSDSPQISYSPLKASIS